MQPQRLASDLSDTLTGNAHPKEADTQAIHVSHTRPFLILHISGPIRFLWLLHGTSGFYTVPPFTDVHHWDACDGTGFCNLMMMS